MTTGRINQVNYPRPAAPDRTADQTGSQGSTVPVHLGVRPIGPSCKASNTVDQPRDCRGLIKAGGRPLSDRVDRLGRLTALIHTLLPSKTVQPTPTLCDTAQPTDCSTACLYCARQKRLPCSACRAVPPPECTLHVAPRTKAQQNHVSFDLTLLLGSALLYTLRRLPPHLIFRP